MSELREHFKDAFRDLEYRHAFAEESLNTSIATQIKVLREQRGWNQGELATQADMLQPAISRLENINYSAWSLASLKRLAQTFDLVLSVKFETFGSLLNEVEEMNREYLQRYSFEDDPAFAGAEPAQAGQAVISSTVAELLQTDSTESVTHILADSQTSSGREIHASP